MSENNLPQFDYDKEADVMYISFGDPRKAVTAEIRDGILLRYDGVDNNKIVGITILNFSHQHYDVEELAKEIEDIDDNFKTPPPNSTRPVIIVDTEKYEKLKAENERMKIALNIISDTKPKGVAIKYPNDSELENEKRQFAIGYNQCLDTVKGISHQATGEKE